jgi:hypothetical protein
MPTAVYREGTYICGPKHFPSPKRADLRGWWNAVRRVMPDSGIGFYQGQRADVTRQSIIFQLSDTSSLVIDRMNR